MNKGYRAAPPLWPAATRGPAWAIADPDELETAYPDDAETAFPDDIGITPPDDTGTAPIPAIQAGATPPAQPEQQDLPEQQDPPEQLDPLEQRGAPERQSRPRPPEPSWAKVIATTVSLWFQRNNYRWFLPVCLVLVVVVPGTVAVLLAWGAATAPGHPHGAASRLGGTGPVQIAQAARTEAASWIAAQVGRNAIVSCDPVMCSVLQGRGYPASDLDVLGPAASDPLDSSLIVATSVLRSEFGTRLSSVYAPVVLASFGTGSAVVQVRAVAPDGAPVYLHQLSADLAARKTYGGQLARNPNLAAAASARSQLEQGRVDSRLITVLATLAQTHRLSIVSFGGAAPGADPELPLRSAIVASQAGSTTTTNVLESLRSFLIGQRPPYLPALTQFVKLPSGQEALSIQFADPYPLELLGAAGSLVKVSGSS